MHKQCIFDSVLVLVVMSMVNNVIVLSLGSSMCCNTSYLRLNILCLRILKVFHVTQRTIHCVDLILQIDFLVCEVIAIGVNDNVAVNEKDDVQPHMAFEFECNIMVLLLWLELFDEINMLMWVLHCEDEEGAVGANIQSELISTSNVTNTYTLIKVTF